MSEIVLKVNKGGSVKSCGRWGYLGDIYIYFVVFFKKR